MIFFDYDEGGTAGSTNDTLYFGSTAPSATSGTNCGASHGRLLQISIDYCESDEQRRRRLRREAYLCRRAESAELWSAWRAQRRFLSWLFPWETRLWVRRLDLVRRAMPARRLFRATRPGRQNVLRGQMRFGRLRSASQSLR